MIFLTIIFLSQMITRKLTNPVLNIWQLSPLGEITWFQKISFEILFLNNPREDLFCSILCTTSIERFPLDQFTVTEKHSPVYVQWESRH